MAPVGGRQTPPRNGLGAPSLLPLPAVWFDTSYRRQTRRRMAWAIWRKGTTYTEAA
jgi:hypothetical protein